MDYAIIGGDDRFVWLARLLKRRGQEARVLFGGAAEDWEGDKAALGGAENVIVNCPPRVNGGSLSLSEIDGTAPASATFYLCGPGLPHGLSAGRRVVDLWTDEALVQENATLTAEGAVSAAMQACSRTLKGARCVVIGWGRIGQALTELLVGLGARVTVASRSSAHRNRAVERGAEAIYTGAVAEALPGARLVFNTAPELALDGRALRRADPEALIVDLASPPYGVDLSAAWTLGLRAWREPGLPGRYCPESAAEALMAALARAEQEAETHD